MKARNQFHSFSKSLKNVNKNAKTLFGSIFMASLVLTSCTTNEEQDYFIPTQTNITPQEFANIRNQALENITQQFQFNADDGFITLISSNGVDISINANCLTKNGASVTGMVDLEYVEIFDKGNMLTTNKPTMGLMDNGDKSLLITGGEFFLEATQDGVVLATNCSMQLNVPANLTGPLDPDMILWTGVIDEGGDLTWEPEDVDGQGGVFAEGGEYYAFLESFGWTNIDRFSGDPRPKTTIYGQAPTGYNYTNSAIYLSYDGEDSGLAALDTYADGIFSEHYGQIPIGLECHAIFVTEADGAWRYAIKSVTIAENDIISFSLSDTSLATEAELISIINVLP